jgi:MFS family permease
MTIASATALPTRVFPKLTLVAMVAFAAITPMALLVAPALAAQLGMELGIGPSQIGTYFFVENGAFSAAALLALFRLGHANVRVVGVIALAVFIAGNLATPLVLPDYTNLLLIRAVTGFGGGTLMVLSMVSGQDADNPDRVYGYWVVGQLIAGTVGLFLLPYLFAGFGLKSFYFALGGITLLISPLYRGFLEPAAAQPSKSGAATSSRFILLAILTVAAILTFYIAIGGVWTFASMAATQAGFASESIGGILAIASFFGIAGAMTATYMGGRSARQAMLIFGYAVLILAVVGLAVFSGGTAYIRRSLRLQIRMDLRASLHRRRGGRPRSVRPTGGRHIADHRHGALARTAVCGADAGRCVEPDLRLRRGCSVRGRFRRLPVCLAEITVLN